MFIEVLSLKEGIDVILGSKVLTAFIIFAFYMILIIPILKLLKKVALFIVRSTKTKLDDQLADKLLPLLFYFFGILGLRYAYKYSGLFIDYYVNISKFISSFLILILFYGIYVILHIIITHWVDNFAKKTKSRRDYTLLNLIRKFVKVTLLIFAVLFILSYLGVNVVSALAGLGIAGIAIAFALQSSLSNIFGGISLILDQAYQVGDKIKLDSGEVGIIQEIGLRSTKIKDFDNKEMIIPNGIMANTKIINYVRPDRKIKLNVTFSVAYGTETKKVKKVVLDVLKKMDKIMEDPAPSVIFVDMAESSLNFKAMAWVEDYNDEFLTTEEARCKIYDALNKSKISIPFPQMDVHIKKK